jgi:glucosylceramidase
LKRIRVAVDRPQQRIDGFGACFNELGWKALSRLEAHERDEVLRAFFDPGGPCRFSNCRMPIGANDFSLSWYSHNEHPADLAMEHFSIERDEDYLLPFIRSALAIRPDLEIWASPWCPPSWMKVSGCYNSASVNSNWGQVLGHDSEDLKAASRLREEPAILQAYALYFVRFIQAYAERGIQIAAVHPQNEVFASQIFPSCLWRKELMVEFIADYLAPAFQKAGLETKIWAGTINGDQQAYTEWVVNHPKLQGVIEGAGFQWAAKNFLADLKRPEGLKLMQTESECHNGVNDWMTGEITFDLLCQYFAAGANSYMYWNFALDEWGLSNWGWRQNSLVTVAHDTGELTWNPDFHAMRHFSGTVDPGAHYLPCEAGDWPAAAFRNPDGVIVVVLRNPGDSEQGIELVLGEDRHQMNLPARHMASVVVPTAESHARSRASAGEVPAGL